MKFAPDKIYHIFNQGNNRQPVFFEEENYLFFLRKTRKYILPLGDILCYCLMPNHFHFLIIPKVEASQPGTAVKPRLKWGEEQIEGALEVSSIYPVNQGSPARIKGI